MTEPTPYAILPANCACQFLIPDSKHTQSTKGLYFTGTFNGTQRQNEWLPLNLTRTGGVTTCADCGRRLTP